MRPLTLHASALNNDEYEEYTKSLKGLADIGDTSQDEADDDDYFERLMLGVREVRAWMRGRYEGLGAPTIDSILKFFSPSLGVGDTLTGGQFLAALRLITHVQHGKALDRALAFVQAHPQPSSKTMPPTPPRRSQTTSEHPQPPQHPSKHPHPHTHQEDPQVPAPQPANHNTTNPFLTTTTNAGPFAPTPPVGIKPRPKPPRSEDGGGGVVGYGYIGGGGVGLSTSPSKAGPPLPPRKPVRAGSPTKAAVYPYGPAKGGAVAAGGDGGTVFVSIATSSSSFGSAPPPPPRPRPQSMQAYSAAPQGLISPHIAKGAPVHASKVSTPSLIDKSLQASRVAQEAKRVEDMREKQRVMQVLKRSGPVEAGGGSGPFKPPNLKSFKTRPVSSNPYPKAMSMSSSMSGSSNDREGPGYGSYGAFASGVDHDRTSGGAGHRIYGTQQPSPPVSTSSLEQVALAVADSDVEDEACGGLETNERSLQGQGFGKGERDEGGRSGGYFGRQNERSVGGSVARGERDDEGRKSGYFGRRYNDRHDKSSVRKNEQGDVEYERERESVDGKSASGRSAGARGAGGKDDGSSRSSRSSHRGLPPRASALGSGAGVFVDSPSSSPGRGVVALPSTSGIDAGTLAVVANKKPPPPPPPPTHPDRKPVAGKSRSRASSRGTSLAGGRDGDNGEDERGKGPASAASAFDAVYARLESPMGSPSPFNAAWSAKFGGDAVAGNFGGEGQHGRGSQSNPFDSPVAPPSAFGGAGFGSRSAGHSRAGSVGHSRAGSLGGRSGSASPLNSNPGSPSIPFGGGLGWSGGGGQGTGTIGRVLRSKSLHYAGGEKPGPFSANYGAAPTLGPFGRLPWARPGDSKEDEGLFGNDVSADCDEGERDGLRGDRRTRGDERGDGDAVDRDRDEKGRKGTGSAGGSRERSYGKGFGFGPPPQHHSHTLGGGMDVSTSPFSNAPPFSGGGSGVSSPFVGGSSGGVSGLSRHTSLGGGGGSGSGHRKSSLSVSSLPQQRHPLYAQQAQGQERDKRPFRMHSTSDHSSDPRYRTRGLEVSGNSGMLDGLGGKPPPPDPSSKPKLQDSFGKARVPDSAPSKPLQSISRLNEKLAGTFEAKIQPKLEKAKFKAEAGLSRRGFVPVATAAGGFHSHTASSHNGREKERLMSEYDGGGGVSDDDRDGVDGRATAKFGGAGGGGGGGGERKLGRAGGGVYSSDSDDQSVFEVGGSQTRTRINADGAPEGGWKALR